jgi:DNA-binding transcriptional MocR family regulator
MADLGVGPGTVRSVVAGLAREGRVVAVAGSGTFVATPPVTLPGDHGWQALALGPGEPRDDALDALGSVPPPAVVDLASGYPHPSLHPHGLLAAATARAGRREGAWGRVDPAGLRELRALFARALTPAGDHQVLVTSGGQSALWTCLRSLARPGDPVVVESPTYVGALAALRAQRLVPVPVPADDRGLRTDLLADVLGRTGARLAYLQPRAANPTGATLPADRRAELMAVAAAHGLVVIEDDWLHDLHDPAGGAPPPLAAQDPDGHVVHVRSLTKAGAPSLRVAGVSARGAVAHRLARARAVEDFFVPGVLQHVALDLLTSPGWARHLARLRTEVASRRAALGTLVARHLPGVAVTVASGPALHVWARLADGTDDLAVEREARRLGVALVAGTPWFPSDPAGAHVRLSAVAATLDELEVGVARVAEAVTAVTAS